jgi:hypothetical protein
VGRGERINASDLPFVKSEIFFILGLDIDSVNRNLGLPSHRIVPGTIASRVPLESGAQFPTAMSVAAASLV